DARHLHLETELAFAFIHRAADGRGAGRIRGAGERDMAFAGEQTGRRVQADPAGAGQIDFAPRVEIGEILFSATGTVERLHVGLELDEVTADETGGEAAMAEQLAEQPRRIAT